jgi:hypothetical protein
MPTSHRPHHATAAARRAVAAVVGLACLVAVSACSNPAPSADVAPEGLIALVAGTDGKTSLTGWDGATKDGTPIALPKGSTVWISAGLSNVLVATLDKGTTATSTPVRLGKSITWRAVSAKDPAGNATKGPDYFATWDPEGGRFATIAGDLQSDDPVRVVLIDPTLGTSFEIPIEASVVAAPPVWLDSDRLAIVTGDAAEPAALLIDTTDGQLTDGPSGARLLASSANGRRIATMTGPNAPVVIRNTAGWLAGDGSSIASITPPNGSTTAIAFALDTTGDRIAIAWATDKGAVTLAVHDGNADWRRTAQPKIGPARGAAVAWLR